MTRRLPAEWEPVSAVLMAWPHSGTDWVERLAPAQACVAAIAAAVSQRAIALIISPEPASTESAVAAAGGRMDQVRVVEQAVGDTWCRDYGPIGVEVDGRLRLLDFGFNGWGLKFPSADDNCASRRLHAAGHFGAIELETIGLILEGGSIESDGCGTVLTTANCLLEANRNPHLDRAALDAELRRLFGADRLLWLQHGQLAGDDTDGHIDTLVRVCPNQAIAYVACDDAADPHYEELAAMRREVEALRTAEGSPYRLVPLPWPQPVCAADGHRLPATYANFLFVNGAVLVPTYADPSDASALAAVAAACPGYEIIGIDCRVLVEQHGSLHCMTMQIPGQTPLSAGR